jgi:hypothetical protein
MKIADDIVLFIPACGLGTRVEARGLKPFIHINTVEGESMAIDRVMAQAPNGMDIEMALLKTMGFPRTQRGCTVHFMDSSLGQANTIYQWLRRTRVRNYVLISNCDNRIDTTSIEQGIAMLNRSDGVRGIVYTFMPRIKEDDRWSYVDIDGSYRIKKIVEKKAISTHAVAGVYLLNMFALRMALYPEDIYLSEALARMDGLYAKRALHYEGWNDMDQLAELERGWKQFC